MRREERKLMIPAGGRSIAAAIVTLLLFGIFFLSSNCTSYNPALYPSYDVLNPGPEVTANPYGIAQIQDGGSYVIILDSTLEHTESYFLINKAFIQWVAELKAEIKKQRE